MTTPSSRTSGATPYWPGSPHTPGPNRPDHNDPSVGDAHAWSVWFGGEPFEAQRHWRYRFMSEFGFQSFPEPRTVAAFTEPGDRSIESPVMVAHQRSGDGNSKIFRYLLEWFAPPETFEETLWLGQLTQALCIQCAAEHARRIQGRMDGLLYWQLNDIWPGATWSSIDVFGRWKALQFLARRFFAPVLVSLVESPENMTVAVHVSNHEPEPFAGTVHWEITRCGGALLRAGEQPVEVPNQANCLVARLDCAGLQDSRELLVWAWAEQDGRERSSNLAFFAKPRHLRLADAAIDCAVEAAGDCEFALVLRASAPALWVRLELDGIDGDFTDNFFHLHPRRPAQIRLATHAPASVADVRDSLRITPLSAGCASSS